MKIMTHILTLALSLGVISPLAHAGGCGSKNAESKSPIQEIQPGALRRQSHDRTDVRDRLAMRLQERQAAAAGISNYAMGRRLTVAAPSGNLNGAPQQGRRPQSGQAAVNAVQSALPGMPEDDRLLRNALGVGSPRPSLGDLQRAGDANLFDGLARNFQSALSSQSAGPHVMIFSPHITYNLGTINNNDNRRSPSSERREAARRSQQGVPAMQGAGVDSSAIEGKRSGPPSAGASRNGISAMPTVAPTKLAQIDRNSSMSATAGFADMMHIELDNLKASDTQTDILGSLESVRVVA